MPKKSIRWRWLTLVVLVVLIGLSGWFWVRRHDVLRSYERATLPQAKPYQVPSVVPEAVTRQAVTTPTIVVPKITPLPPQANLAVPFTVQAPHANWDEAHEEFCEEASILMAISYVTNQDIPTPEFAEQQLQNLKTFEEKRFGYYQDTTIEEVAATFREYYNYHQVRLLENPTSDDLKHAVAQGQLVVVPAAGRLLGNPYFQQPGPLYHMIVIKGYTTDGQFIVHDPGTRRGADFLYSADVVMRALHNWRSDEQIELGQKVVLLVG